MMKLEFGSTPIVIHLRVGLIRNVIRPDLYNSRFCSWTKNELPLLEIVMAKYLKETDVVNFGVGIGLV
jgi:hypothetical protein